MASFFNEEYSRFEGPRGILESLWRRNTRSQPARCVANGTCRRPDDRWAGDCSCLGVSPSLSALGIELLVNSSCLGDVRNGVVWRTGRAGGWWGSARDGMVVVVVVVA
jgi:hypothetical protein